jgi:phospholipid/cholesterol/gamma-HCH transport system substrate-binding protein
MPREQLARVGAFIALGVAVVVVAVVLFTGGSSYKVYAQFPDAGQLVQGDLVTVAGHKVGGVGGIRLSNNGLAEVELDISDPGLTPLHQGTIATVGQLSLTGVANRFVGLTPTSTGPKIPDGGIIPPTQTKGIVDLDVLLDALTPKVRKSLQRVLATGAYLFSKPSPQQFNASLKYFNPALSQTQRLGAEIVADKFALDRLVASTADVSTTLAGRNNDLAGAVTNTAATFRLIASERAALEDAIARSPAVLAQATAVMKDVDFTLGILDPTLVDLQPVAPKLATLLQKLLPAAANAVPLISGVEALVHPAKQALTLFPKVEKMATPAVKSLTAALKPITPILAGFRAYTPDIVGGFFKNFTNASGHSYDANGTFVRVEPLTGPSVALTGLLALLSGSVPTIGPLNGERDGLIARCPGGGVPPATSGGNPWNSPDLPAATGDICNPSDNQQQ